MESILIKINPKSIRKNPNAFRTQTTFPTTSRMELSFSVPAGSISMAKGKILAPMPYPEFILDKNILIERADCTNESCEVRCVSIGSELHKFIEDGKKFEGVEIEITQDFETINHPPEPEYFYKYEDTIVKCNSCHDTFKHTELTSDEDAEGRYMQDICPNCFASNCCDIDYEKFDKSKYGK